MADTLGRRLQGSLYPLASAQPEARGTGAFAPRGIASKSRDASEGAFVLATSLSGVPEVSWLLLPSAAPSSYPVAHTCRRGPVIHSLGRRIATWELIVTSLDERVDAALAGRSRRGRAMTVIK